MTIYISRKVEIAHAVKLLDSCSTKDIRVLQAIQCLPGIDNSLEGMLC